MKKEPLDIILSGPTLPQSKKTPQTILTQPYCKQDEKNKAGKEAEHKDKKSKAEKEDGEKPDQDEKSKAEKGTIKEKPPAQLQPLQRSASSPTRTRPRRRPRPGRYHRDRQIALLAVQTHIDLAAAAILTQRGFLLQRHTSGWPTAFLTSQQSGSLPCALWAGPAEHNP